MNKIVKVSPSVLADVIACNTKGWTKHVRGYTSKGEAIKAVAGQAFHAAIASYLKPYNKEKQYNIPVAVAAFHKIYDDAYARLTVDKLEPALVPANLDRLLRRWFEMHPPQLLPWRRVWAVEEAFISREWWIFADGTTFAITPGVNDDPMVFTEEARSIGFTRVQLIVRPDIVVEDLDGRIRFVDTKTTGWRIGDESWRKNLKLSMQVQLYADAVKQKFGDKAVYGGWINAIEMRQLPSDPNRKCSTHGIKYSECGNEHAKAEFIECLTTPKRVERAVEDARLAAITFLRLQQEASSDTISMQGTAKGECRFCPAAEWCLADRPDAALESFMLYEPWVVSEGVRE